MGYLEHTVCWFCGGRKKNKERTVQKNVKTGKFEVKQLATPVSSALLTDAYGYGTVHEYCLAKFIARKTVNERWNREKAKEKADIYGEDMMASVLVARELLIAEIERRKHGKTKR
jgi:hypothetical protein